MQSTTARFKRVAATVVVSVLGALMLGASVWMAGGRELGEPSQAAADALRSTRAVQISDVRPTSPGWRYMALVESAHGHGRSVQKAKPIGSTPLYIRRQHEREFKQQTTFDSTSPKLPSVGTAAETGGFAWTYPGVLAGLSLAFVLLVGGVVLVSRRVKRRGFERLIRTATSLARSVGG